LVTQVNQIDSTINDLLNSKKKAAQAAGGIVNDSQLLAEVYQEKQPMLLQRQTLVNQMQQAQSMYQDSLKQAGTETGYAQTTFQDQQAQQKQALQTASTLITQIGNGSLDISQVDPSQLSQIEQAAGLPSGILSKLVSGGAYAAHSFVQDNNGNTTFVGVKKNGQVTTTPLGNIGKSNAYGTPSSSLSATSTLQDFFGSYAPAGDGSNDPSAYATAVAQQLGIDPSTPITKLAGQETALAKERLNYPLFFKREALKAEIQIDDCIPVGSLSPPATAFR
jgi:hypothetical protein